MTENKNIIIANIECCVVYVASQSDSKRIAKVNKYVIAEHIQISVGYKFNQGRTFGLVTQRASQIIFSKLFWSRLSEKICLRSTN